MGNQSLENNGSFFVNDGDVASAHATLDKHSKAWTERLAKETSGQPVEDKPQQKRLENWLKHEMEVNGLKDMKLFQGEKWNSLTPEERAKAIMDMIEAPTVPDPDFF